MISLLVSGIHAALLAGPPVARGVARFFDRRRKTKTMALPRTAAPSPGGVVAGSAVPASWARYPGARPEVTGRPAHTVIAVDGHRLFTTFDYEALFTVAAALGVSADALMILMRHESHLDATAWNGIAAGLVQITKNAAVPGFDTLDRVQAITRMTPREQFEGPIFAHLRRHPRLGQMTPGELLLWNFTPAFSGRSEDTVISRKGEAIYEANHKALDREDKGWIRVSDLYRAAERICAEAGGRRALPDGRVLEPNGSITSAARVKLAPVPAVVAPPRAPRAPVEAPAPAEAPPPVYAIGQASEPPAAPQPAPSETHVAEFDVGAMAPQPSPDSAASYGMQFSSSGPEDDDVIAESDGEEDVIERFKWTIQYDTVQREGRFVRTEGGVEMRYAGIDGATRKVPVDIAYTPPSLDEIPVQLQRAARVSTEVGFAARALLGWLGQARKPYGSVIPFEVGGTRYAARVEKHSNAAIGLSIFVVTSDISSGGAEVEASSSTSGILLSAVKAGTADPNTWTWVKVEDDLEVLVMDDALKCEVGGRPHVRAPVSWAEMREIARLVGCVPPLKEWVDAIYAQAAFHPTFVGQGTTLMNSVGTVLRYHEQLEAQLAKAGVDTSATFVEPIAKWWIFSDRMPNWEAKYGVLGVAGLYASVNTDGTRIQPDSAVHDANHSDYSMVCRLVSAWGRRPSKPGEGVDLIALMQQRKPQLAAYIALFQRES